MKYKIYAGLGGGFGGADYRETLDFDTKEEAEDYAYQCAIDECEMYGGLHGLPNYTEIEEENPDWDEEDIDAEYNEQRESWLSYSAEEVK